MATNNTNYFKKFGKGEGVPFMEGREGASLKQLRNQTINVEEFAFIKTEHGPCAVFTIKGDCNQFFFANQGLNDMFEQVQNDGMEEELKEQNIHFLTKVSQNRREYTTFEFVDESGDTI